MDLCKCETNVHQQNTLIINTKVLVKAEQLTGKDSDKVKQVSECFRWSSYNLQGRGEGKYLHRNSVAISIFVIQVRGRSKAGRGELKVQVQVGR